ncbi:MAG TPA: ZIP family metal transporter [Bacillota bacterium]|nr:ZIP family metal transporter [Bacillota bacterium]HOR84967.1 ZIP family metal transporter [Bacillota bacterium]HPL52990.1 ZIP family metal transporter [Bacillota bacterium]
MNRLFAVTCIGFLCGTIGTGLGGILTIILGNPTKRFMAVLLGFTSGIMISVVCFDLLPEAFNIGGLFISLAGIVLGVGIILIIEQFIPEGTSRKPGEDLDFIRSGILLGIGIAIHNFPEGLAVGSGFAASNNLGLGLAAIIGIHDMPEGIAMAVPLRIGGTNRIRILLYTVLAGIPMGLGAFVGELLGQISPEFICLCLSFAGGAMLYITCGELIPKTHNVYKGRISAIGMIAGILCGIIMSNVI